MANSSLRERWQNIPADLRAPVESIMGALPRTTLHDADVGEAVQYSTLDAIATLLDYTPLYDGIAAANLEQVLAMDMGVIPLCDHIQKTGMLIDKAHFHSLSLDLGLRIGTLDTQMFSEVGHIFNPESPDQISELLFQELGIHNGTGTSPKRTPTGRFKADSKTLEAYKKQHPVVPLLLERREYSKLKGTFVDKLPMMTDAAGRVHTRLRITRVPSGRFSSTAPNLQQIPIATKTGKRVRQGFISPEGYLLGSRDLSAIEMRAAGHLSRDPLMLEVLCDDSRDIHYETAARVFGIKILPGKTIEERYALIDKVKHRYPCKRAGFLILYGGTAAGLSDVLIAEGLTQWTVEECEKLIEYWYGVFEGFRAWTLDNQSFARIHGYVTDGLLGRRILIPQVRSSQKKIREEGLRLAQNAPCQCLPEYTRVRTQRGFERIGTFVDGTPVWTGERWAPATLVPRGEGELVEVQLSDGAAFHCDKSHRLLVQRGPWPEWVLSTDLLAGDKLADSWAVAFYDDGETVGTPELWYWIGRYYGDGWMPNYSKRNAKGRTDSRKFIGWAFGGVKAHEYEECVKALQRAGFNPCVNKLYKKLKDGSVSTVVNVTDYAFDKYAISLGVTPNQRAHSKRLADIIFRLDHTRKEAVLKGYYDADGTRRRTYKKERSFISKKTGEVVTYKYKENSAVTITSVGVGLLRDVQLLMRSLGKYAHILGPYTPKAKEARLVYRLRMHRMDDPAQRTVRAVVDLKTKCPVYTLSVDDERHAFDSEGVISKNSLAATVLKLASARAWCVLNQLWAEGKDVKIIMSVHDELVFEAPIELAQEVDARFKPCFEECVQLATPVRSEANWANNWGDLK